MTPTDKSKEVNRLHRVKAVDSFNARFNLLLYHRIREGDHSPITNEELDDFDVYAQEMMRQEIIFQEDSLLPDWVKKFGVTLLTKYLALKRYMRKLINN